MHTKLIRHDLLQLEDRLTEALRLLFPFTAHAVYFPREEAVDDPVWVAEEGRLLLPLRQGSELLGVFMARVEDEAAQERMEALLPALPGFLALTVESLRLYKAGRLDPLTGLSTRHVLFERLDRAVRQIRETVLGGEGQQEGETGASFDEGLGSLGLVVVSVAALRDLARETSHGFVDDFTVQLAGALKAVLPEDALAARSGDTDFALLVPGADKRRCEEVAIDALRALGGVHLRHPFTGRAVRVAPCAGFALFPQDMDGVRPQDVTEPAPILLHKAHLAAERLLSREARHDRVMAWGDIAQEGGRVLAALPLGRLRIDLGRGEGVHAGLRFSLWSTQQGEDGQAEPLYKGEVVLLETREHDAVAEVLHLGDPAWLPEQGDTLLRLPEDHSVARPVQDEGEQGETGAAHRTDPITGLWRHGEFLARLAREREGLEGFSLALVHVGLESDVRPEQTRHMEQAMAQAAERCRAAFAEHHLEMTLGGRFALNSLMFFFPKGETELEAACAAVSAELNQRFGSSGIGLFTWPFMDFHPADAVECCRKALEYALLLPAPHVGWFDSLAMNISADKLHCRGDVFGAMEEYKLALLADADNALAWNSLGVCLAGLGRHAEARRHFEEAMRRSPDDPALAYNLGAVCRNLGDDDAAEGHFARCLALTPTHLYARIRLGQIARHRGQKAVALALFEEASAANPESGLPQRHLASLALASGDAVKAREHLHEALLRNPRDAQALALMARLYLDNGEDPAIAETLARQSLALRPRLAAARQQLARALEAMGNAVEARRVLEHTAL